MRVRTRFIQFALDSLDELSVAWRLKRYYRKLNLNPSICFDVGANRGRSAKKFAKLWPKAKFVLFEPDKRLISELMRLPNSFVVEQKAVGNKNEKITFKLAPLPELNSAANFNVDSRYFKFKSWILGTDSSSFFEVCEVQSCTLDSYCREKEISKIDFLKLDVEGYEFEALEGAIELLSSRRIGVIQVEVSNTKQRVSQGIRIQELFESLGYLRVKRFGHLWGNFQDWIFIAK